MRAAMLCLLAACGDNASINYGLDAAYADHDHSRFFGIVQGYGPAPARTIANLDGAQVCIADACTTTANSGQFVLVGTGPGVEATLVVTADMFLPTIVPVVGGAAGDRNLGPIPLISPELQAQTATVFGADPMTDSRGTVLLNAARYDMGAMQLAIDGLHTYYLDAMGNPSPTATQLSTVNDAVWYGLVPDEESVVHATAGHCDAGSSGWPGAAPGETRIPASAGSITFVSPFCYGP
jgi:hypothetical protein